MSGLLPVMPGRISHFVPSITHPYQGIASPLQISVGNQRVISDMGKPPLCGDRNCAYRVGGVARRHAADLLSRSGGTSEYVGDVGDASRAHITSVARCGGGIAPT